MTDSTAANPSAPLNDLKASQEGAPPKLDSSVPAEPEQHEGHESAEAHAAGPDSAPPPAEPPSDPLGGFRFRGQTTRPVYAGSSGNKPKPK